MITLTQRGTETQIEYESAQKTITEIEAKHRLHIANEQVIPTVEFLGEVASSLGLTKTAAFLLWYALSKVSECLRVANEEMAKLAYWYKIDPYRLTAQQRIGLIQNLPVVQAQQRLADGNFSATDYEGVYRLVKLATGCEKQAREARRVARERYVDQQTRFK